MKSLLLLVCVFVTVLLAARDPSTVCLPKVLQVDLFDFDLDDTGVLAFDYDSGLAAVEYDHNERLVFNLTSGMEYIIGLNGTCVYGPTPAHILVLLQMRCLPATAKVLNSNATQRIGIPSYSVTIESYEIDVGNDTVVRVAVTTDDPAIPVLRHYQGDYDDLEFYINPQMTIDNPLVLNIPDNCVPMTG